MFKENHYYLVTHKEEGFKHPVKCIIQAIRKNDHDLWRIKIIKIIHISNLRRIYREGLVTDWYEEWCSDIREINDINDVAELLAIVL